MTRAVIVPSKRTDDTIPVQFPFADQLEFGEVISGQAVTCVVFTGTDANPSEVLEGAPTTDGTTVTQIITGGVVGNIYQLVALVNTSNANIYSKSARVAIINEPEAFFAS